MRSLLMALGLVAGMAASAFAQASLPVPKAATLSTTTCPGAGCTVVGLNNRGKVGVEVTGTFVGTLTFKATSTTTTDCSSANFVAVNLVPAASATQASTATAVGLWRADLGGFNYICVVFTAYTSGSAVVTTLTAP